MTLVGFAGLLFALSAAYFANLKASRQRFVIFVLLLVMHTLSSGAFYLFAQNSGSDAHFYFYDLGRFYGVATGFGTPVILNAVQIGRETIGGTFFDYFMIFNAIGFWGLVFLTKTIQEIHEELAVPNSGLVYLPLFLPGLHFWTGFIGKDAPLFFAVSLAVWACFNFHKRLPALGLALAIALAVRPHIAAIAFVAIGISAIRDAKTKLWMKTLIVIGVVAGTVYVVTGLQSSYGINISSAEGVSEFMAGRSSITEESGADLSIVQANFPIKVFSLWLRPFFFDAENIMGYIASMENAALLLIFAVILRNFGLLRQLFTKVLFVRFCVIFFLGLTGLLAAVNFNIGLGLRQKMMALPCLIAMLATLLAVRASAARAPQLPPADVPIRGTTPQQILARGTK